MHFSFSQIKKLERLMGVKKEYSELEKEYFQQAQNHLKYLKFIPGISLIAIGNSVAMKSSHNNSDIDLFIITQKDRLWFVRIVVTMYFFVLRKRKTSTKHAQSFCLSFFIDTNAMNFSKIAIDDDIYLFYWILTLRPILNYNNTYQNFISLNNWANFNDYSNYTDSWNEFLEIDELKSKNISIFLDGCNGILRRLFLPRSLKKYKKIGEPFGVIINDSMLKFHDKDKRKYFSKEVFEGIPGKNIKNL